MKTKIAFILILLIGSDQLYSQNNKLAVGFDIGPSYTYFIASSDDNPYHSLDKNPTIKFSSGLLLETNRTGYFDYSLGLYFERKSSVMKVFGNEWTIDGVPSTLTIPERQINFDYLTLPISAMFKIGTKRNFYIKGGMFTGYLLNSFETVSDLDKHLNTLYHKKFDFGILSAVGGRISLSEKNYLNIELKYNYGIANISKYASDGESIKTNSFILLIGVRHKI